jgi:hypothetical protein
MEAASIHEVELQVSPLTILGFQRWGNPNQEKDVLTAFTENVRASLQVVGIRRQMLSGTGFIFFSDDVKDCFEVEEE